MTPLTKEQIKAAADRAEARASGKTVAEEFVETALSEGEIDVEVGKLAELPIGVYESSRVEGARRLKMRASVLDALVATKRGKGAKTFADFMPHWSVEPWAESVNGDALLTALRAHIKTYVVLPNKHAEIVLPLWILHTWVFDCFDITPYLVISSPTRRCGKSLLMTLLNWLCRRAKKNDSMSKAAIYRSAEVERPTLVLDETSWVMDLKDERQGILCGGFERLGHVELCDGEGANITVKRFSTYCPKAFGIIGKLTATLMDRSIEIPMQRKLKEDVARLRRRDSPQHAELRQKCLRWADDNMVKLAAIVPALPAGLNDRAFDIWEPLLAIAECAGGDWLKVAAEAAVALSGGDSATEEKGVELLRDIKAVFDASDRPAITTKTLIAKLCADEERPWATYGSGVRAITDRQLGNLLSGFGITSDTVHPNETGEPKKAKGYRQVRCEDAFSRYLTAPMDPEARIKGAEACKRTSADETGTSSDFFIRAESSLHGSEKCEKPANDGGLHPCTDKNPQSGNGHDSGTSNGSKPHRSDIKDARAELALLEKGLGDDLSIPQFLDRRGEVAGAHVCARCGRPGDLRLYHSGIYLHRACRTLWNVEQPS
jgi:putative DNA primase/helicase